MNALARRNRILIAAFLFIFIALSYFSYFLIPASAQKFVRRNLRGVRRAVHFVKLHTKNVLGRLSEQDRIQMRRLEATSRAWPFRRLRLTIRRAFQTLLLIVKSFFYTFKGIVFIITGSIRSALLFLWHAIIGGIGRFEIRIFSRLLKLFVKLVRVFKPDWLLKWLNSLG
jgi:hypothetical protein